jgi:hypothetical protein
MGMMKRVHFDNVVRLYPPRPAASGTRAWWWMDWHAEWWEVARGTLDWKPISTYEVLDPGMALATPYILRDGDRWAYGALVDGVWTRIAEGGSYPLDDFEPSEWADVDLDEAIGLGQD